MEKKSELPERFAALLKERGLKYTFERKVILEEASKVKNHFDADAFYASLKKKGFRISRDTVYRTLPLLLECGVLQKSVGDSRREYFERVSGKGHHDHMVCITCGKVIEFHSETIEKGQQTVCETYGFTLVFHDHRLFGHCRDCAQKSK